MRYRDRIWSPAVLLLTSVNLRISSIRSRLDIFSAYSTHINYAIAYSTLILSSAISWATFSQKS